MTSATTRAPSLRALDSALQGRRIGCRARRSAQTLGSPRCKRGGRVRVAGGAAVNVASILAAKVSAVVTIRPTDTVGALCERLRERRIGAAVVSSDGQAVEGVISERDVAYGLAVHKAELASLPVSALMTRTVITCSPSDSVSSVAATMI